MTERMQNTASSYIGAAKQTIGETLGYPDLAASGAEGLAMFRAGNFDVVLTDLGMPEIDGREVTRIVKTTRLNTPVILVTGWGASVGEDWDDAVKADYLLRKPVTLSNLRDALCAVLD